MKLNLHPNAAISFNCKAEALLDKFVIINKNTILAKKHTFEPDHFISSTITEKEIIGDIIVSSTDLVGNEIGRFFDHEGNRIGLSGENYHNLLKLSENMQRTKQLSPFVSVSFLKDTIFNWMKDKYLSATYVSMTDFVINKCEQELTDLEIWIPIAETFIQSDLQIGKVILKTISKEVLDKWMDHWGEETDKKEEMKKGFMIRYQKKLQGHPAATIKLIAEPNRAFEIAVEESEKALSILRIFGFPVVVHPGLNSYTTLLGKEHLDGYTYFLVNNEKLLLITEGLTDKSGIALALSSDFISMIKPRGLDVLSEILAEGPKTKFQEQVLDSLFIYSRSPLAKDVADKLIYILVAMESILLKDENEPIQQNISKRMAYLIGNTVEQRKDIIANIIKIYKLRSSFIHHGQRIEDMETLLIFMKNAWIFFHILIKKINKFKDKQDLIDKIENAFLSGSSAII